MPVASCFLDKPVVKMAGAMLLPNIGGWVSGIQTRKHIKSWYETLELPKCRPPNWVFPPMWTSLYTAMGYASYVVWKQGNGFSGPARIPLMLYGTQLALNWAWTPIFFGQHQLKWVSAANKTICMQ
jgi:benzodiazapine receptor